MKKLFFLSTFILLSFITAAQWQHTNGPACQPTVIHLTVIDSVIYACTGNSLGIYISHDDGDNWTPVSNGIPLFPGGNVNVTSLVRCGSVLLAGTNTGVYRSTDNGANWSLSNTGLNNTEIEALVVIQNNILAGTYGGGIFRSQDNGLTWGDVNNGIWNTDEVGVFAIAGSRVFAGASTGLYYSDDNGWTWYITTITDWVFSLAVSGQVVLAETMNTGLYRSMDDGNTWTIINNGQPNSNAYVGPFVVDGALIYASGWGGNIPGIMVTADYGDSWSFISYGYPNGEGSNCLAIHGTKLFSGITYFGIYRTGLDKIKWLPANNGIPFTTITSLSSQWVNLYAGTNGGGLYLSTDAGVHWDISVSYGLGDLNIHALCQAGQELLVGTDSGVYVTLTVGYGWTRFNNGLTDTHIRAFAFQGNNIFAGTDDGVYLTTDEGYNWVKKTDGLTNKNTRALLVAGTSVFAGMKDGGLFRSDNNGANWMDVSNGLTNLDVTSLAAAGSVIFTGTGDGLFRSQDNGQNWTTVSSGLGSSKINALLMLSTSLFAGTDKGIYLSADLGDTWESINDGLPDTVITSLGMSRTDLYAGVLAQNVWIRPLSELLSLEINPQNLVLNQNASSSDTLFIIANSGWSVRGTLPEWLSMSKTSGSGSDEVIFTSLQDNQSNAGRVAVFTVESTSGGEKAFSVLQKSAIAGIEDPVAGSLVIYPNPTEGTLNIVSRKPISSITVYDPAGYQLLEKQVNAENTEIDLSGMPKELLFIKISGKDGIVFRKILVK